MVDTVERMHGRFRLRNVQQFRHGLRGMYKPGGIGSPRDYHYGVVEWNGGNGGIEW